MSADDPDLREDVTDLRLNAREPLQCNRCGVTVAEGETVVVRLHQDGHDGRWLVTGRFCPSCGPVDVDGPKPFAAEMVVRGTVGTTSRPRSPDTVPVLLDPEILDRVGV